jgi:hypothetical protein
VLATSCAHFNEELRLSRAQEALGSWSRPKELTSPSGSPDFEGKQDYDWKPPGVAQGAAPGNEGGTGKRSVDHRSLPSQDTAFLWPQGTKNCR